MAPCQRRSCTTAALLGKDYPGYKVRREEPRDHRPAPLVALLPRIDSLPRTGTAVRGLGLGGRARDLPPAAAARSRRRRRVR